MKPLVALLVLALAPASWALDIDRQTIQSLWREGEKQFEAEKFDEAASSFKQVIDLLPAEYKRDRANAHYWVACAYSRLKRVTEAVDHLDKSMEHGFRNFDFIARDADFDPVRKSEQFVAVLEKYRKIEEEKLQGFDFDLVTTSGKKIAKKDFLGKVLVVDVWGTWCPPCRMEIPHFIALQKKYGEAGLQIVGLNSEKTSSRESAERLVRQFIESNKMNYPCAIATDDVLRSVPGLRAFPTTLFIGRDGRVRHKIEGYHPYAQLESLIKPLLAEKVTEEAREDPGDEGKAEKG